MDIKIDRGSKQVSGYKKAIYLANQKLNDELSPNEFKRELSAWMLSEMFDGDIDDLDLGNFSQGLLDLLFSGAGEIEVFRVYN